MIPRVLNKRTATAAELKNAVYVGRPSVYGNPFIIGRDGDRNEVIEKYRALIEELPANMLAKLIADLRGRDLVCWCAPKPCHADYLLKIANV